MISTRFVCCSFSCWLANSAIVIVLFTMVSKPKCLLSLCAFAMPNFPNSYFAISRPLHINASSTSVNELLKVQINCTFKKSANKPSEIFKRFDTDQLRDVLLSIKIFSASSIITIVFGLSINRSIKSGSIKLLATFGDKKRTLFFNLPTR